VTYRNLIFAFFFFIVAACDCHYHVSGVVINERTGMPVSNAAIGSTDTTDLDNPFNRKSKTNELGEFEVHGIAGVCSEVTMYISNDDFVTQKVTFQNNGFDTVYLKPKGSNRKSFDLKSSFEIVSLRKTNDYPSSLKDTTICLGWTLDRQEIKKVIELSEPIDGPDWHHLFEHLPCRIIGVVKQNEQPYGLSINGGAWFTISSSDTTLMYGSFSRKNNKYFLKKALVENLPCN
jgi:hypothetical protein